MLAALATFLVKNMIIALMLAVGLSTTPAALRTAWDERRLVLRGLIVLELGVPLLALATVKVVPLSLAVSGVIALVAVCPGAPLIVRKVRDRPVVVLILAVVSVLAPITVTAWVAVLDRAMPHELAVHPATIAKIVLLKQVLPLAIGVGLAALQARAAAWLSRLFLILFFAGLAIALALVLAKGMPALLDASAPAIAAVVIVVLGSAAMGHVAGGPRLEDRGALGVVAVLGNPALAAAVIAQSYPGFDAMAVMAAYLILRALALLPYMVAVKQWSRRSRGPASQGPPGPVGLPTPVAGH